MAWLLNYSILLCFVCFFASPMSAFQVSDSQVNEIIRSKIEEASSTPLVCLGESINCTTSLSTFYQNRLFEPAWSVPLGGELLGLLLSADQDGLRPTDYQVDKIKSALKTPARSDMDKAERDLLLTDAFLLYCSHMLSGKVNSITVDPDWHVVGQEGDPVAILELAITQGNLKSVKTSITPQHQDYTNLKQMLREYRSMDTSQWKKIEQGPTIKLGMTDSRLLLIRDRLIFFGDLSVSLIDSATMYNESLSHSILQFQRRHGLEDDGNIGDKTISALNISPSQRAEQIKVNLERWRWLPLEFGNYYVNVNIARFKLEVVEYGQSIREHKIIVGKPFRSTPIFSSKIEYLVFNPTWTIPPGILNADIIPGARKDLSYLKKKNISVLDSNGNPVNPSSINWNSAEPKSYTYRQPAGPDNALGAVKFMFPNKFHVYLHDTPSKELFNKTERAFSSGCIRVQEPLSLAEFLLQDELLWSRPKIDQLIKSEITTTVALTKQPDVHLIYLTTWTEDGEVYFGQDIYQRDQKVADALNQSISE